MFTLSAADCYRLGPHCHNHITINNDSNKDIVVAFQSIGYGRLGEQEKYCTFLGNIIDKNTSFNYNPYNWCIESSYDSRFPIEIYIIRPNGYDPNKHYNCNSMDEEAKEIISKKYVLTLQDLKRINFTINYQ